MKRYLISLVILITMSGISAEIIWINPTITNSITTNVLEDNGRFTVVEIKLNHYRIETEIIDGEEYLSVSIPNIGMRAEKGNPELFTVNQINCLTQNRAMISMVKTKFVR